MLLALDQIEQRTCDAASTCLGIPRNQISPASRFIEDLRCDSLDVVEMIMLLEREFGVELLNESRHPIYKSVFTRSSYRLGDLSELIFLQVANGQISSPSRHGFRSAPVPAPSPGTSLFTQLNGRWTAELQNQTALFDKLETKQNLHQYRRRSDGMRCLLLPGAEVEIGSRSDHSQPDERPSHLVGLDSFLIDAEPVSTTAFCRFLNSIHGATEQQLKDWFVLDQEDDRQAQMQIQSTVQGWEPLTGTETMPMVLVSWFGANAYSLWANGEDWKTYRCEGEQSPTFLPSEAQWEYAARGPQFQEYSWNDQNGASPSMNSAAHQPGTAYTAATMPLVAVHDQIGMSPFGLHHMAGNVWQWCQDWYSDSFYQRPDACGLNPVNRQQSGIRSERGGSWVGPAELCRSSYRRGRTPLARGRCLGFRCISSPSALGR